MDIFSILALNRPLRWLGSATWEALFNCLAFNIGTIVVYNLEELLPPKSLWPVSIFYRCFAIFTLYTLVRCNDLLVCPGVSGNPFTPCMPSGR